MKKYLFLLLFGLIGVASSISGQSKPINVVFIGAHPDDADFKAGGTAFLLAEAGSKVLFVSVTDGGAGHQSMDREDLIRIRKGEAAEAARRLGISYYVLDHPDGGLTTDIAIREEIIRIIREWKADVVITHRPNDYHPDHRNTAILVQDASYMVIVPKVVPGTEPLDQNPVFLYAEDGFQKPYTFQPDISIDISSVFDKKIYAMSAHESQFFDWLPWTDHSLDKVPSTEADRLKWLSNQRKGSISSEERASLQKWYGKKKGSQVQHAESFEISEFGRQPNDEEIRALFPMLKTSN